MARKYRSRSEVVMALVLAMVNRGWSEDAILKALRDPRHLGGAKVQAMSDGEARTYVAGRYKKAATRVRDKPATHEGADAARVLVTRWRALTDLEAWPGIRGATARRTFKEHCALAAQLGALTWGASDRWAAVRVGVSRECMSRSVHPSLIAEGWLRIVTPGRGRRTTVWGFGWRMGQYASPFSSSAEGGVRGMVTTTAPSTSAGED